MKFHLIPRTLYLLALLLPAYLSPAFSQSQPSFVLPDVLTTNGGKKITNTTQWRLRRKELLELFSSQMYGRSPARPAAMTFKVFDNNV
ncbi:MAG: hypothetical protein ABIN89_16640, partial [Chitinophagaceae bacterium]